MSLPDRRAQAARVIYAVSAQGRSLTQLMPPLLADCDPATRGQLQDWCFGSCRWYHRLEGELKQRMRKPLGKDQGLIKALLILGLYQLRHTRIAPHAAIHETVAAARTLGAPGLTGLVNGILRGADRDGEPTPATDAMTTSHPEWMLGKLKGNYPEQWQSIAQNNNGHPPMTLRVNRRHLTREQALEQLAQEEIDASPCPWAPQGIQLARPVPVDQLPGFFSGHYSVQDEAAQLCTTLLQVEPGQRVLDACAAPGGKTGAILESQPELAELVALDQDASRLEQVQENLDRIGQFATLKAADARDTDSWWDGMPFQRILLDAPCSGTGVMRRHPDIKLLRRETDIKALADLQLELLQQCWRTLATGGRLVYATCSVFPQENSRIISRFVNLQLDAELELIDADWGQDTGYGRQLLPQQNGHDGFFYASLRKNPAAQI
ncbi:MAG: 16S rRNA (cytosine(967)-C(5))-methyltransferase RsmB [Halomonadaceae bacterium]|nr:MAG: 16S rRNA (cytosine(967)-C(5))-methyltransferase RsmB [Halomonadaceae bacterium]